MDPVIDSWAIDPSELLRSANLFNNNTNSNNNNNHISLNTPQSEEETNVFSLGVDSIDPNTSNYYDIDNFLTQELRDLDIPMIPTTSTNDIPQDQDSQQFNWDYPSNNPIPTVEAPKHKRGVSGTAIFGFAGHNKTLSISSLQRSDNININNTNSNNIFYNQMQMQMQTQTQTQKYPQEQGQPPEDDEINQLILRQQEELRSALERQRLVNQKLQEQLKANQLQQERLQRALEEQNMGKVPPPPSSSRNNSNTSSSQSPSRSFRTPIKPHGNNKVTAEEEALIVTSNSADGRYQFPPPSMISPPLSNTSLNGSPGGRRHITRYHQYSLSPSFNNNNNINNNYNQSPLKQFQSSSLQTIDKEKTPNLFQNIDPRDDNGELQGKDTTQALNSPFPSTHSGDSSSVRRDPHKRKESVLSTVSTIPLSSCESDTESTSTNQHNPLIGLGLTMESSSINSSNKTMRRSPMKIDIMPTISASKENTPVKQHPQAVKTIEPQKHMFQHTPVKQRPEYIIMNNNVTPILNPPTTLMLQPTSPNMLSPMVTHNFLLESPPMPPPVEPHVGPMKITRKPTTLPRGSIDQYVKELPNKTFECLYPNCGKSFKRRYNLRSHIQTHLEDRPYKCDYPDCGKAFVRNHDMIRHKRSHFAETYNCSMCNKKFIKKESCIQHEQRMTCQQAHSPSKNSDSIKVTKQSMSPRKDSVTPHGSPARRNPRLEMSPVKYSVENDHKGYVTDKLQKQLTLQQSETLIDQDCMFQQVLTPSPPSGLSDLE